LAHVAEKNNYRLAGREATTNARVAAFDWPGMQSLVRALSRAILGNPAGIAQVVLSGPGPDNLSATDRLARREPMGELVAVVPREPPVGSHRHFPRSGLQAMGEPQEVPGWPAP